MASEIAAPKPDLGAKAKNDDFEKLFKRNFKRKITSSSRASRDMRLREDTMILRKTQCFDIHEVCQTPCFQKGMKILQVLEAYDIYISIGFF